MADREQAPLSQAIEEIIVRVAHETLMLVPKGVVQLEDLCQWGRVGALMARSRFDPRFRVHFKDYARHRIRGAMYDGVRSMGVFSRRVYDRLKRRAVDELRQRAVDERLVGEPTPEPMDGPTREHDARITLQAIVELATCRIAALNEVQESPETTFEEAEAIHRVREAMQQLTDEEQQVVRAVYDFDEAGDSGAKLAARIGRSRSAVSRRHRAVLDRLRQHLKLV